VSSYYYYFLIGFLWKSSLIDQVPFDQSCSSWICFIKGWNDSCDHVEETNRIGSTYIFTDYIVYGKLYTMCICMLGESILVHTVSRAILSTMVRYGLKKSKITQRWNLNESALQYIYISACKCMSMWDWTMVTDRDAIFNPYLLLWSSHWPLLCTSILLAILL